MLYDLVIIGGGPAGTSAAVYAARKKLKTILIAKEFGGQSIVSEKIYNWIGTISLSGHELAENLKNHVLANVGDALSVLEEDISSISKEKPENLEDPEDKKKSEVLELFKTKTKSGKELLSKTILIASGSGRRKLSAKNAEKLEHKGLTYCASCDGPLFAGKDVAVIGGGNAGFETAAQLLAYCNSVTLLHKSDSFKADPITVEKVLKHPKMKAIKNVYILEIKGENFVEGIIYRIIPPDGRPPDRSPDDNVSKEIDESNLQELKVQGIFVEIGAIPNTNFVGDLVPLDEFNRIKINPMDQKTEVPGIWAAGDCTNCLYHQNNIAAGDGVRALEDIYITLSAK